MREMHLFTGTLVIALFAAWLLSGYRFLDSLFEMADLGQFDDIVIEGAVILEEGKASLSPPDLFSALRAAIHRGLALD